MEDRAMGMVVVQIRGSFGNKPDASYSAMEGGHAMAITRAIGYLTSQLPSAIKLDHQLQTDNERPPKSDFGELPAPAQVA
jgi:hypothetical protein